MDSDELYIGKKDGIYCKEKKEKMKHHASHQTVAMQRYATPMQHL